MSALDYDETDPEILNILGGVAQPAQDEAGPQYDLYYPTYDSSEVDGFQSGYQYAFDAASARSSQRRNILPTLDDHARGRLRQSQGPLSEFHCHVDLARTAP